MRGKCQSSLIHGHNDDNSNGSVMVIIDVVHDKSAISVDWL